jgi:hypothetical protein
VSNAAHRQDADASEAVLSVDEYAAGAGASMIAKAVDAASLRTPSTASCDGYDAAAAAGADALTQMRTYRWKVASS